MTTPLAITERWVWLIGSLGIAILVSGARWLAAERRARAGLPSAQALWEHPWIVQPLRLLYAIGIPAAALIWRGVLTPSGLGLKPVSDNLPEWASDLGWAALLGAVTWAVCAWGDWLARHRGSVALQGHVEHSVGTALIEAAYHQAHWAFYREPFVLIAGAEVGAWLGLIPVMVEAIFNPQRWLDLQHPASARNLLVRAAVAVGSTLVYLQTRNLWVALAMDAALGAALGRITAAHTSA